MFPCWRGTGGGRALLCCVVVGGQPHQSVTAVVHLPTPFGAAGSVLLASCSRHGGSCGLCRVRPSGLPGHPHPNLYRVFDLLVHGLPGHKVWGPAALAVKSWPPCFLSLTRWLGSAFWHGPLFQPRVQTAPHESKAKLSFAHSKCLDPTHTPPCAQGLLVPGLGLEAALHCCHLMS